MICENVELHNVEEIIEQEDGKLLLRIPDNLRKNLNENAKRNAFSPAGCEIRFNLKQGAAKIILKTEQEGGINIAEVYQGIFKISTHIINKEPTEILISVPQNIALLNRVTKEKNLVFDAYLTRVVLPHLAPIKIVDIKGEFFPPEKEQIPKIKYLAYGSSITHGSAAIRPTGSYAMRTAYHLGVDLINLGFGGGAHCEREIADYIAGRNDWNFATLEIGINMVGGFETEEFKKRAEYLIEKIATTHPDKRIFCMDLFTFYADFDPNSRKQNEFRKIVKEKVKKLNMPKLVHIDGRKILRKPSGLMTDLVHPSPEGMEEIASNLSSHIKKFL